jgi:uncharacterized protein YjbI with pentapeptide repeats
MLPMANDEHIAMFKQGVVAWNVWRKENPNIVPDLHGAILNGEILSYANRARANMFGHLAAPSEPDLKRADLTRADLRGPLREADLFRATFGGALREMHFVEADLKDELYANLSRADLSGAYLSGANLSGAILMEAIRHGFHRHRRRFLDGTATCSTIVTCSVDRFEAGAEAQTYEQDFCRFSVQTKSRRSC